MLSRPQEFGSLIRWSADGSAFVFAHSSPELLATFSRYFRHSNVHSFVRQLSESFIAINFARLFGNHDLRECLPFCRHVSSISRCIAAFVSALGQLTKVFDTATVFNGCPRSSCCRQSLKTGVQRITADSRIRSCGAKKLESSHATFLDSSPKGVIKREGKRFR